MNTHLIKPHLLVVGGTGFIGYHLVKAAKKKGWKVTSISAHRVKKHRYVSGVKYLLVDIGNFEKLKKKIKYPFTHVVNLSGYVDHTSFFDDKLERIIKTHFFGTINLTKAIDKKKIKKFIQIGSSVEYGKIKAPQKEHHHGLPNSPYSLAKLASTNYLMMLHKTQNFPVTILRLFQVYGPNQDSNRVLPQIIKGCLNNNKFPVSKGNQVRDFCYIDDVISAIFLSLTLNRSKGEIFNIGNGKPLKIKKAINLIKKIIGFGKPQFGKIKYRKDENMNVYPNINKVVSKLKWKPKINFNQGIKISINSLKKKYD